MGWLFDALEGMREGETGVSFFRLDPLLALLFVVLKRDKRNAGYPREMTQSYPRNRIKSTWCKNKRRGLLLILGSHLPQ